MNNAPSSLRKLFHAGTVDFISNPRPSLGETVQIRLFVPHEAQLQNLILRTIPNGEQQFCPMQATEDAPGGRFWTAELLVNEACTPYRFGLQSQGRIWWLNALGLSQTIPPSLYDFKLIADHPAIPWLKDAVFYQIFPDRFANGNPGNDPDETLPLMGGIRRKTFPWSQAVKADRHLIPFYGGDLEGIRQKLPYLQELGVNAIYLNPVFHAYTNHRYDTADYRHVDPILGGDEALQALAEDLHRSDMRYMLDIVPNHCGAGHPWFLEAQSDPQSPLRARFFFDEHNRHASWMNSIHLPKLNYACAKLREEMYAGEDSIFAYWLKAPFYADAWRVDVANMLGRQDEQQLDGEILPAIRRAVKEARADCYLIGENFYEAGAQLQGQAWDAVMNYTGFTDPLLNWLCPSNVSAIGSSVSLQSNERWSTEILCQAWSEQMASIPWAIALQEFNLLDSHDTPRLLTSLGGDKILMKLALAVQFAFPGIPCIYYGDEVGMIDEPDWDSRGCFPWDESKWDMDLRAYYQKLIALRKNSRVLQEGAFRILYAGPDLLVFERFLGKEHVLLTANRAKTNSPALQIEVPGLSENADYHSAFGEGESIALRNAYLNLPALAPGAQIWLRE